MSNLPQEVLQRLIYGGVVSADRLAVVMEVDRKTVYKYADGDRDVPATRLRRASHFLERELGRTDLADCFHTPEFVSLPRGESTTDGRIEDEVADLAEATGLLRAAHREGSRTEMDRAIRNAELALQRARAERDHLA